MIWWPRMPALLDWNQVSKLAEIQLSFCWRDWGQQVEIHWQQDVTDCASIISIILGALWIQQLSMTITELGAGNNCIWSSVVLIKSMNRAVLNEPSTISQDNMPLREIAGRMEYLRVTFKNEWCSPKHIWGCTVCHKWRNICEQPFALLKPKHNLDMLSDGQTNFHQQRPNVLVDIWSL